MTENEAYAILHPDTTRDKLAEIEYYAGFKGVEAGLKAIEDACIIACDAMVQLALYEEIGTVKECKEAVERMKPKKPNDIVMAKDRKICVGRVGKRPCCGSIVAEGNFTCDDCFQVLDWSE